jgi:glycosyltransferase involved in cell wall biosynthesis
MAVTVAKLVGGHAVEHAHNELQGHAYPRLSFRAERVFAVSDSVKEMLIKKFNVRADKIVDVDNVPVNVSTGARTRPDVSGRPRLLAVGRVDHQKDPERFLRVVRLVSRTRPVAATWIGDGPLLPTMKQAAKDIDNVAFAGWRFDSGQALAAADVLLVTSAWEGMPLVVLEAFATGVPVVSTPVGGLTGLFREEGCGLLVGADCSDQEYAEVVLRLLADHGLASSIVLRGERMIQTRFCPDVAFAPMWASYRSLLG